MTIQISPDELQSLLEKTAEWYAGLFNRFVEVFAADRPDSIQQLKSLRQRYEQEKPVPTWKDLLP